MAMFMGLSPNPASAVLAGLTIATLPYMYAVSLMSGETTLMLYSIIVSVGTCALLIYVASAIFNKDVIVLGLRIPWARKTKEKT